MNKLGWVWKRKTRGTEQVSPEWWVSKETPGLRIQKLVKLFSNYKFHELKAVKALPWGESKGEKEKGTKARNTEQISI